MAIEISKKNKKNSGGVINTLFYIGSFLLFLIVISTALVFYFSWNAKKDLEAFRSEANTAIKTEINRIEKNLQDYEIKAKDFDYLLNQRNSEIIDKMFRFIEGNLHPDVYISGLQMNPISGSISTVGNAKDLIVYDQQINIFKNSNDIESFSAASFNRDVDGRVSFPISITIKK